MASRTKPQDSGRKSKKGLKRSNKRSEKIRRSDKSKLKRRISRTAERGAFAESDINDGSIDNSWAGIKRARELYDATVSKHHIKAEGKIAFSKIFKGTNNRSSMLYIGAGNKINIYKLESKITKLKSYKTGHTPVVCMAIDPSGSLVSVADSMGHLHIITGDLGSPLRRIQIPSTMKVTDVSFCLKSGRNILIAIVDENGRGGLLIWSFKDGVEIYRQLGIFDDQITSIEYNPRKDLTSDLILLTSKDGTYMYIEINEGGLGYKEVVPKTKVDKSIELCKFALGGMKYVLIHNGNMSIYDIGNVEPVKTIIVHSQIIVSADISVANNRILLPCGNMIKMINLVDYQLYRLGNTSKTHSTMKEGDTVWTRIFNKYRFIENISTDLNYMIITEGDKFDIYRRPYKTAATNIDSILKSAIDTAQFWKNAVQPQNDIIEVECDNTRSPQYGVTIKFMNQTKHKQALDFALSSADQAAAVIEELLQRGALDSAVSCPDDPIRFKGLLTILARLVDRDPSWSSLILEALFALLHNNKQWVMESGDVNIQTGIKHALRVLQETQECLDGVECLNEIFQLVNKIFI